MDLKYMVLVIVFLILLIFTIKDYLHKNRVNKILTANGIGGNKYTLPLIGDLLLAVSMNTENFIEHFEGWRQKYGKTYRLWYLNKCLLVVQDAEYIKHILNSTELLKKSFFYDQISVWLGDGMLVTSAPKWQILYKAYLPLFNIKLLTKYVKLFEQESYNMVDQLRPLANGSNVIDISHLGVSTALDMLLKVMHVNISAQCPEGLAYLKSMKRAMYIFLERFFKPFQQWDFVYKIMSYKSYRSLHQHVRELHAFSEKIVNEKLEEMAFEKESDHCEEPANKSYLKPLDILTNLTIAGKPLTYKEIREEIDNMLLGGHDTTGSAISFILYLLSRHPQEQQKVFEEVVSIMGTDPTQPVDMSKLQEMKYLELVIKESLRLYPPVPLIARVTEKDHKFGDKIIPKNTEIIFIIYSICRDPEYFSRPNEFVPERFLNEEINPYVYIPFSNGPRSCMGRKFAFLQLKTVVSCILRHYELLPLGPDVVPITALILYSRTGVNVGLKPRVY